jgi:hypothetical protein
MARPLHFEWAHHSWRFKRQLVICAGFDPATLDAGGPHRAGFKEGFAECQRES